MPLWVVDANLRLSLIDPLARVTALRSPPRVLKQSESSQEGTALAAAVATVLAQRDFELAMAGNTVPIETA